MREIALTIWMWKVNENFPMGTNKGIITIIMVRLHNYRWHQCVLAISCAQIYSKWNHIEHVYCISELLLVVARLNRRPSVRSCAHHFWHKLSLNFLCYQFSKSPLCHHCFHITSVKWKVGFLHLFGRAAQISQRWRTSNRESFHFALCWKQIKLHLEIRLHDQRVQILPRGNIEVYTMDPDQSKLGKVRILLVFFVWPVSYWPKHEKPLRGCIHYYHLHRRNDVVPALIMEKRLDALLHKRGLLAQRHS